MDLEATLFLLSHSPSLESRMVHQVPVRMRLDGPGASVEQVRAEMSSGLTNTYWHVSTSCLSHASQALGTIHKSRPQSSLGSRVAHLRQCSALGL